MKTIITLVALLAFASTSFAWGGGKPSSGKSYSKTSGSYSKKASGSKKAYSKSASKRAPSSYRNK